MISRMVSLAAAVILLSGTGARAAQSQPGSADSPAGQHSAGSAQVPALRADLKVVSIDFTNFKVITAADGTRRGSAYVAFTYENAGNAAARGFRITWDYWDHASNSWQLFLGQLYDNVELAAGKSFSVGGQPWTEIGWTIGADSPRMRIKLDTANTVAESNETNNEMIKEYKPLVPASAPIPKLK